jgi:ATP-dependent Lon protease
MPLSARRQLTELSDEMATKPIVVFYSDARDALVTSLAD